MALDFQVSIEFDQYHKTYKKCSQHPRDDSSHADVGDCSEWLANENGTVEPKDRQFNQTIDKVTKENIREEKLLTCKQ